MRVSTNSNRKKLYVNYLLNKNNNVNGYTFNSSQAGIEKLNGEFGNTVRLFVQIEKIIECNTITLESLSKDISETLGETIVYDSFEEQTNHYVCNDEYVRYKGCLMEPILLFNK